MISGVSEATSLEEWQLLWVQNQAGELYFRSKLG